MVHMILKKNQGGIIDLNGPRMNVKTGTCLHLLQTASINGYKDQLIQNINKEDDYDYQKNQNRIESEG